jgi:hypothetical protein
MTLLFYHFFIVPLRAPLVSLLNWYKRKCNQRWKRQVEAFFKNITEPTSQEILVEYLKKLHLKRKK